MKKLITLFYKNPKDIFQNYIKPFADKIFENEHVKYASTENDIWKGACEKIRFDTKNYIYIFDTYFFEEIQWIMKPDFEEDYIWFIFQKIDERKWIYLIDFYFPNSSDLMYNTIPVTICKSKELRWIQHANSEMKMLMVFLHKNWAMENFSWNPDYESIKWADISTYLLMNHAQLEQEQVELLESVFNEEDLTLVNTDLIECKLKYKVSVVENISRDLISTTFKKNVKLPQNSLNAKQLRGLAEAEKLLVSDFKKIPPSLKELAKIAGMNRKEFQIMFKQIYGNTFYKYFQEHRFLYAKYLIENMGSSSSKAAFMIGYKSFSHFSSEYYKQFGKRPKEAMQHFQEKTNDK